MLCASGIINLYMHTFHERHKALLGCVQAYINYWEYAMCHTSACMSIYECMQAYEDVHGT